jgi:hypothetical protein
MDFLGPIYKKCLLKELNQSLYNQAQLTNHLLWYISLDKLSLYNFRYQFQVEPQNCDRQHWFIVIVSGDSN